MFMFLCPCCQEVFLTAKNIWMNHPTQWAIFDALYEEYPGILIVGCKQNFAWEFQNAHDFDQISVSPSLDASAAGHWHGFIRNGAIA
jgi:hypothetical protein